MILIASATDNGMAAEEDLNRMEDIYGKPRGPRRPITPYQKKGPSRSSETSKDGTLGA
jgi:hypothetical protein